LLKSKHFWLYITLAMLIGLGLRLYQLGENSFWVDEIEVAKTTVLPTLANAVSTAMSYTAGMPLDCLVAWVMARVSPNETWLRLPEALWGTLTLLAAALLFRKLSGERAAVIAAFLLALSPIHIHYSQELRFYAPLVFFYLLLTACLLSALQNPNARRWAWVVLVSTVGAYFHLYVLLAWINGALWLLFNPFVPGLRKQTWRQFILTGLISAALVLPGCVNIFTGHPPLNYVLLYDSLPQKVMMGLGMFPFVPSQIGLYLGFLCLILSFLAFIIALRSKQRLLLVLIIAAGIQVALVIAADIATRYFFHARQFIMLLPFTYLMVGTFINHLFDRGQPLFRLPLKPRSPSSITPDEMRRFHRYLAFALLFALGLTSAVTLLNDFQQPKDRSLQISQTLHANWQIGEKVWVNPEWDPLKYKFYLDQRIGDTRLDAAFLGVTWDQFSNISPNENGFLITQPLPPPDQLKMIASMGFIPYPNLDYIDSSAQSFWLRRK